MSNVEVASTTDTEAEVQEAVASLGVEEAELTTSGVEVPVAPTNNNSDEPQEQITSEGDQPESSGASEEPEDVEPERVSKDSGGSEEELTYSEKTKKRMDQLLRDRLDARREADNLRNRIRALEEKGRGNELKEQESPVESKSQEDPKSAPGKPRREDYLDDDDYMDARDNWRDHLRDQTRMADIKEAIKAEAVDRIRAKERNALDEKFRSSADVAREKYKDFDQVVKEVTDNNMLHISEAMQECMLDSDVGAEIMYWLSQNTTEADRIASLSPIASAKEIWAVENEILGSTPSSESSSSESNNSNPPALKSKKISRAPKPVRTVGSSASASKRIENMTLEEFDQYRRAGGQ
jgi:hypothetical protein